MGYPFGSCTRANLVLPYIDVINNVFSDCLGGVWVRGISALDGAVIFARSRRRGIDWRRNLDGHNQHQHVLFADLPALQ